VSGQALEKAKRLSPGKAGGDGRPGADPASATRGGVRAVAPAARPGPARPAERPRAQRGPERGLAERAAARPAGWFVYLIECADGSIYTGIATDVARRFAEHAAGRGARYTRARPPRRLLGAFPQPDRSSALRAEHAIRRLSPARKRALCEPGARR
jgi:putative endonuclease